MKTLSAMIILALASEGATVGTDTFNAVIGILTKGVMVGGGLWTVWGAVVLGSSLKDHNGPGMQSGIWQIVGGMVILAAAALFNTIAA